MSEQRSTFAWNWFRRARKATTEFDEIDVKQIAQECGVTEKEVKENMDFLSTDTTKKVEVFKFLVEQILNV